MKVLFHHIPKCSGHFIRNQYSRVLGCKSFQFITEKKLIDLKRERDRLIESGKIIKNLKLPGIIDEPLFSLDNIHNVDNIFIFAHEFDKKADPLLKNPDWLKITCFRNPFTRFFSQYAQRQRNNSIDRLKACVDLYQFYFFYLEWCRDNEILELTEENAPTILKKAIEYLNYFDSIFIAEKLDAQILDKYNKPLSHDVRIENRTDKNLTLQINYELAMNYCKYLDFDYKFYNHVMENQKI